MIIGDEREGAPYLNAVYGSCVCTSVSTYYAYVRDLFVL